MPPTPASVVEQWQSLPRAVLQDKVRQVVKRRDADAKQIWAHVRANSVLAAQVRGALSALRAEVRGTRDEVMWTMWIDQARSVLDASPEKPAPSAAAPSAEKLVVQKAAPEKAVTEKPAVEKKAAVETPAKAPQNTSAPKPAAEKTPSQEKPAAAQSETPSAEKRPAPVKPAFTATKPESEPEPAQQLTYTPPPADKPRTAPAVAPVMFQAPGT